MTVDKVIRERETVVIMAVTTMEIGKTENAIILYEY
jgi:hypothetical protein